METCNVNDESPYGVDHPNKETGNGGPRNQGNEKAYQEGVFTLTDTATYDRLDDKAYEEEIKKLHQSLVQGDVNDYCNIHVKLPRWLQGMRTASTIARILELNS